MKKLMWFIYLVKRSLGERKSRLAIAVSTLLMGTALTTALVGVSSGIGEKLGDELRSYGANILVLPSGARIQGGATGILGQSEQEYLSQQAVTLLTSEFKEIITAYAEYLNGRGSIRGREIPVTGTYFAQVKKINQWWKVHGAWPVKESEALVGINLAEKLKLRPGTETEVSGSGMTMRFKVAGILETGGPEEDVFYLEMKTAQRLLGLPGKISLVTVSVRTHKVPLQDTLRKLQTAIPGAEVKAVRQIAGAEDSMLHKVQWLMALVTLAVLIAAGISVMSTMSAIVLERRKEIGLLKALGGTGRTIGGLFYADALVMGGAGGISGFIVGLLVAQLISHTVFGSLITVHPVLFLLALLTGFGISLLASFIPVRHALRVDPIVSLNGE
ncbi:MAG: ABC transporter permease [Bacillota bacterium]